MLVTKYRRLEERLLREENTEARDFRRRKEQVRVRDIQEEADRILYEAGFDNDA